MSTLRIIFYRNSITIAQTLMHARDDLQKTYSTKQIPHTWQKDNSTAITTIQVPHAVSLINLIETLMHVQEA